MIFKHLSPLQIYIFFLLSRMCNELVFERKRTGKNNWNCLSYYHHVLFLKIFLLFNTFHLFYLRSVIQISEPEETESNLEGFITNISTQLRKTKMPQWLLLRVFPLKWKFTYIDINAGDHPESPGIITISATLMHIN